MTGEMTGKTIDDGAAAPRPAGGGDGSFDPPSRRPARRTVVLVGPAGRGGHYFNKKGETKSDARCDATPLGLPKRGRVTTVTRARKENHLTIATTIVEGKKACFGR